jgi:hypothetical protein
MINISPALFFTLDGTLSHTPGWRVVNTLELAKPAKKRGTSPRVLPGAAGARALPLRADATERVLNVHVYGRRDGNGTVYESEIEGLQANLEYLATSWAAVPATSDSTRTCVLHRRGTTTTGPVQVLDMDWDDAEMPIAAMMIVRLLLPAGALS